MQIRQYLAPKSWKWSDITWQIADRGKCSCLENKTAKTGYIFHANYSLVIYKLDQHFNLTLTALIQTLQ
jgi:hypothetical protein